MKIGNESWAVLGKLQTSLSQVFLEHTQKPLGCHSSAVTDLKSSIQRVMAFLSKDEPEYDDHGMPDVGSIRQFEGFVDLEECDGRVIRVDDSAHDLGGCRVRVTLEVLPYVANIQEKNKEAKDSDEADRIVF